MGDGTADGDGVAAGEGAAAGDGAAVGNGAAVGIDTAGGDGVAGGAGTTAGEANEASGGGEGSGVAAGGTCCTAGVGGAVAMRMVSASAHAAMATATSSQATAQDRVRCVAYILPSSAPDVVGPRPIVLSLRSYVTASGGRRGTVIQVGLHRSAQVGPATTWLLITRWGVMVGDPDGGRGRAYQHDRQPAAYHSPGPRRSRRLTAIPRLPLPPSLWLTSRTRVVAGESLRALGRE